MMDEDLTSRAKQLLAVESNPSRHEWHALVRDLLERIEELKHPRVGTTTSWLISEADAARIARQDHL